MSNPKARISLTQGTGAHQFLGPPGTRSQCAAAVLHRHLDKNDGYVEVACLSVLYCRVPWLKSAVGHLASFCAESETLCYVPRSSGCGAVLRRMGSVTVAISSSRPLVHSCPGHSPRGYASKSARRHDGRFYADFFEAHLRSFAKLCPRAVSVDKPSPELNTPLSESSVVQDQLVISTAGPSETAHLTARGSSPIATSLSHFYELPWSYSSKHSLALSMVCIGCVQLGMLLYCILEALMCPYLFGHAHSVLTVCSQCNVITFLWLWLTGFHTELVQCRVLTSMSLVALPHLLIDAVWHCVSSGTLLEDKIIIKEYVLEVGTYSVPSLCGPLMGDNHQICDDTVVFVPLLFRACLTQLLSYKALPSPVQVRCKRH